MRVGGKPLQLDAYLGYNASSGRRLQPRDALHQGHRFGKGLQPLGHLALHLGQGLRETNR